MDQLRSEFMSKRVYVTMFIIMVSVLALTIPLLMTNYQNYSKAKKTLAEIESLEMMVRLANELSKERAPANKLMSGHEAQRAALVQALQQHRKHVDLLLNETIISLQKNEQDRVADYLDTTFRISLKTGRQGVDQFAAQAFEQRQAIAMDQAIFGMYDIWDDFHRAVQQAIMLSEGKDSNISNYYMLILLLSEFRDQAGRVASNVMAPVTFSESMSETNIARSLQNQHQVRYLWSLVAVLLSEEEKTPNFLYLHQEVKTRFLDQTLPLINRLIEQSLNEQPYEVSGTALTDAVVDHFKTVVALQSYLIEHSLHVAEIQKSDAEKKLLLLILLSCMSISLIVFTMLYSQQHIFSPLIRARRMLLELSLQSQRSAPNATIKLSEIQDEKISLFTAIQRLQKALKQRDDLEKQLTKLANTDSLTGVSNRFALSEYLKSLEDKPNPFKNTCLMLIDIDHFKQVNDVYGHTCGDRAIRLVAETITKMIRSSDLVVRYGGDEFIVFLENIEIERATEIAGKILQEIQRAEIPTKQADQSLKVSVSIGLAIDHQDWKGLFDQADQALFRAKEKGRNNVSS